jgi:hypothetical protein
MEDGPRVRKEKEDAKKKFRKLEWEKQLWMATRVMTLVESERRYRQQKK